MELEGEDGTRIALNRGSNMVHGRGSGFNSSDRTVSRRHVSFQVADTDPSRVSFQVLGKNPVWVLTNSRKEIKLYRKLESDEITPGDLFCVSGNTPVWFALKKAADSKDKDFESENELPQISLSGVQFESVDVSGIDPVKEFGFVVMGHEFDGYMIRDIKDWEWFLEEPRKDSDDEDDDKDSKKNNKRGMRRKKSRKVEDHEDEDWTGESEGAEEVREVKLRKVDRPKYSTRSKAYDITMKDTKSAKNLSQKKTMQLDEDDEETLGGFIVNEDDMEQEDEEGSETEEEEEFVEDDDD